MATVPTGYVFWDVSANKSYAAGKTFPTLGNGDYLVPATTSQDGYYHAYWYYTSHTMGGLTITNAWHGNIDSNGNYKGLTQKVPFNTIADKPVCSFSYNGMTASSWPTGASQAGYSTLASLTNMKYLMFYGATNLAGTVPNLPTSLESLQNAFYGMTKITAPPANFNNLTKVKNAYCAFYGASNLASVPTMSSLTALTYAPYMFQRCSKITTVSSLPPNLVSAISMFSNCTALQSASVQIPATVTDARSMFYGCTSLTVPPTFAANAAMDDIGYMFQNCTSLTYAPTIVSPIRSIYMAFKGCTSLVGNIRIESDNLSSWSYAFDDTDPDNQIILLGPSSIFTTLKRIASGANNENVYAGIIATPASFTAIRGTYDSSTQTFEENVAGTYCKLTINYKAPYVTGALLKLPTMTSEGDPVSVTWHIGTLSGAVLTSAGTQVLAVGTLVAVISLGSSETAASYRLSMNTAYSYDEVDYTWASGTVIATLTYSNALIDVNPTGIGMAFFGEVPDDFAGMLVKKETTFENPITAEDTVTVGDVVIADDFYLELDENAASGDDYEIIQALTALGWTDCLIND